MTKRNNPKVMSVTGSVNRISKGLTKTLSKPSTNATISEVVKLATDTPGMKCAMIITKSAVIIMRISWFISIEIDVQK